MKSLNSSQERKDTNLTQKDGLSTSMAAIGRQSGSNRSCLWGMCCQRQNFGCEFHFKQSVVRHARHLNSLKMQQKFKILADKLMTSATPKCYKEAYDNLREFIEVKPKKRGFLSTWLQWWNDRKGHFARAFKSVDAA